MAYTISHVIKDIKGRTTIRLLVAAAVMMGLVATFVSPSSAATFSNPTPIVITYKAAPPGCPGAEACRGDTADPYPSTIQVGGLPGTITDVNVTLNDFSHASPSDVDIMVQMPDGMAVLLMSDACGDGNNPISAASAIDLTFDDQAPTQLPADSACSSGVYRPVDDDSDTSDLPSFILVPDAFPVVGTCTPTVPCGENIPYSGSLSTFNGMGANGTWALYVINDGPGTPVGEVRGQIVGGWSLDITTSATSTSSTSSTSTTQAPPTSTTQAPPTSTTQAPPTSTTQAPPTSTTQAPPTSTTQAPPTSTTQAPPTSTTQAPPTSTTQAPPTSTTSMSTTTTSTPPGGPMQIDDLVLSNGDVARVTGTIACDEGNRFRTRVIVTQDRTEGQAIVTGTCTGEAQRFRAIVEVTSGPGFEDGPAQARAVTQVGNPNNRRIVDRFSTTEEVEIEIAGGMGAAVLTAMDTTENSQN